MANKRIDELTAATPVIGDFVATTGVGGPATKATVKQVYDANISTAMVIAYTGTAPPAIPFLVSPSIGVQSASGTVAVPSGVVAESLAYPTPLVSTAPFVNNLSSSLTFSNLCGVNGNVTVSQFASMTSLSFPVLSFVHGNINISSNAVQTALSLPNLAYIGGSFSTNGSALVSLSLPVLKYAFAQVGLSSSSQLTLISAPTLTVVGSLGFVTCNLLNSVSMPSLTTVCTNIILTTLPALVTWSLPAVTFIGGSFQAGGLTSLTTVSMPVLKTLQTLSLNGPNLMTAFSLPALESTGHFSLYDLGSLTSVSLPAFAFNSGRLVFSYLGSVTALNLPALTATGVNFLRTVFNNGDIYLTGMGALTTFTLPVIEVIGSSGGISIDVSNGGTAALSTFTLGSTLRLINGNVIMTSCALLVASVDDILVRLAALDGTGLTTAYSTKTVTITGTSATPSATGLAAKATLVARGCTVTHN